MALYAFEGRSPKVAKGAYIHPTAEVIGEVEIGPEAYIGPGARVKADYGRVVIGARTSIQDNCVIHVRPNETCTVGADVTVGHGAILHNCTVHDEAVVGMGAIVSDYATIGRWAVVAEGAVVTQHTEVPPEQIVAGVPARPRGRVEEHHKEELRQFRAEYLRLVRSSPGELRRLD